MAGTNAAAETKTSNKEKIQENTNCLNAFNLVCKAIDGLESKDIVRVLRSAAVLNGINMIEYN